MVLALLGNRGLIPTPSTPTASTEKTLPTSPPVPTPSKLRRFLAYAEKSLGVERATNLEFPLHMKGFGPDVLHLVSDDALAELGINPGNIIRLKTGCVKWWNGADAKRKRGEGDDDLFPRQAEEAAPPPPKKVRYEKRYTDGGGMTFHGPPLVEGGGAHTSDYEMFYYCEVCAKMVRVPPRFSVIEDSEDQDDLFNPF